MRRHRIVAIELRGLVLLEDGGALRALVSRADPQAAGGEDGDEGRGAAAEDGVHCGVSL